MFLVLKDWVKKYGMFLMVIQGINLSNDCPETLSCFTAINVSREHVSTKYIDLCLTIR